MYWDNGRGLIKKVHGGGQIRLVTCTGLIYCICCILFIHVNCRVTPQIKEAGESVGINFTGKADRCPNTIQAHVLLEYLKKDLKVQNQVSEALFQVYFLNYRYCKF